MYLYSGKSPLFIENGGYYVRLFFFFLDISVEFILYPG